MPNEFDPYYEWLGIPPKYQPPNYYRLLGIDLFEPDQKVINDAASQRYLHVQSFQTRDNVALVKRILKEIIIAGVCLLTPDKKANFDSELKSQFKGVQQELNDPFTVPMEFSESINTSQIIKAQGANKDSQLWSASVGILMLVGLIITVLAIHKNLQDVTNPHSNGQISNHTVSKPSDNAGTLPGPRPIPKPSPRIPTGKKDPSDTFEINPPKPPRLDLVPEFDPKKDDLEIPPIDNKPQPKDPPHNPLIPKEIPLDILPSGKRFEPGIFDTDIEEVINQLNNSVNNKQLIILHYPDGHTALAMHRAGVLDGVCVAISQAGQPITFVNYKDGLLDGMIKTWNEKGRRIYWCQYVNGFRNGFCCYYKDDQFRLPLEIYRDTIRGIYLIGNGKLEGRFDPSKQDDMDENTKNMLKESRSQVYTLFNRDEKFFEKQFNEEYLRLQRELLSIMRTKGLNAVQNRIKEYNNECQKLINNLRSYDVWKKSVW